MPDFTNPTVVTIMTMLAVAVGAFFLDKIHAVGPCDKRQAILKSEMLLVIQQYEFRLKEIQERLRLEEDENRRWQNLTLRLAGVLEKNLPANTPRTE